MEDNQTASKIACGARLTCFALWGILTLMATAAFTHAVPVSSHENTAATPVATE